MAVDAKMLNDIEKAEPIERKAMLQVVRLSKPTPKIKQMLWTDDSKVPKERRKRDFRIVIDDLTIPFEVKADFSSKGSGNIALEYECHGKPSGLAATESKVWIQMVPVQNEEWIMYFSRVSTLREHLMVMKSGIWIPNEKVEGTWPWSKYRRLTSNARSGDSNPSMNMLLNLDMHINGKDWWNEASMLEKGSIDWRLFAVV